MSAERRHARDRKQSPVRADASPVTVEWVEEADVSARPSVSIVIPSFNGSEHLRGCLAAVRETLPPRYEVEILVVEDGSDDAAVAAARAIAREHGHVRVLHHETNLGFVESCNAGAQAARGEVLVFLNNDTVPLDGWLDALVGYADTHPKAAVVGSKLLFPDGTVQHAGMVICQDRYPRHIYMGFPGEHPAVNKSRRYQIVTGACALIRREQFWEVGGFDPSYQNSYEDVELCLRLGKLGYEVHYCHESVLYHLESATREGRTGEFEASTAQYRERWWHRVQPDDLQYYADDGLLHVAYRELYPVLMAISPLLAVVEEGERERQADALLNARARQVFDLLRQNIRLAVQAQEAELAAAARSARGAAAQPANGSAVPALAPQALTPMVEPTLVARGAVHTLGQPASGRLV
jgi:GT2 family glycosyltransferase